MTMSEPGRWQMHQVYGNSANPSVGPDRLLLLDTETGEIWELDQQKNIWDQMPRQTTATNPGVAATGVWRSAQLEKLIERSMGLLHEVVRGYNWTQADLVQLDADVSAAGIVVP